MNSTPHPFPKWFWFVIILALLWFLMDMSAFVMRTFMLDTMLETMPENQQTLYHSMPSWVNGFFALEVFGGILGCVFLILKKSLALRLFQISLLGVLAQTCYVYFLSDAITIMGTPAIVMPLVAVVIGVTMLFLAKMAKIRKWVS